MHKLNHYSWPVLLWVLVCCTVFPAPLTANDEPRQIFRDGESPAWLRAVGTLIVPGIRYENGYRRHHTERCSATLISDRAGTATDIIVSAWHCVDYYDDLSQVIRFELASADGTYTVIPARLLNDGGSIDADWAILRLARPVTATVAPSLQPLAAPVQLESSLVMAGFSRDKGLGAGGSHLTYDSNCRVTALFRDHTDSNCRAHKGASGGAVIQVSEQGKPSFAGVISQGDGESLSRFIPVSVFKQALRYHLGQRDS